MFLQSIKSVKHNAAKSVNRSILKKSQQLGFGVIIVHSSMIKTDRESHKASLILIVKERPLPWQQHFYTRKNTPPTTDGNHTGVHSYTKFSLVTTWPFKPGLPDSHGNGRITQNDGRDKDYHGKCSEHCSYELMKQGKRLNIYTLIYIHIDTVRTQASTQLLAFPVYPPVTRLCYINRVCT